MSTTSDSFTPCDWEGCPNPASQVIPPGGIYPEKSPSQVWIGEIVLCSGHMFLAQRDGHINLPWTRVLKAMEGN